MATPPEPKLDFRHMAGHMVGAAVVRKLEEAIAKWRRINPKWQGFIFSYDALTLLFAFEDCVDAAAKLDEAMKKAKLDELIKNAKSARTVRSSKRGRHG